MTPGPGNELTPSAADRGHLRASHDDRERVVDFLKAAFVQGRLTKEELEARTGQALGSRTYAELAGLTADLPGGSIAVQPPREAARARRLPTGKVVLVGTGVLGTPAVLVAAILTGNEELAKIFALIFPFYLMAWVAAVWQIIDNLRQGSRGQSPPHRRRHGWAPEGEQDGGTSDDLMLAEARNNRADRRPCRRGRTCARRPRLVRPARHLPGDLHGAV